MILSPGHNTKVGKDHHHHDSSIASDIIIISSPKKQKDPTVHETDR
jgi:hypothetical protein